MSTSFSRDRLRTILHQMCRERPDDLLELMEGESKFTLPENGGGAPSIPGESRAWIGALYHVRFMAKYADRGERFFDGRHWQSPFPEEFEQWVRIGAPGIGSQELESYLAEYPHFESTGDVDTSA